MISIITWHKNNIGKIAHKFKDFFEAVDYGIIMLGH